MAYSECRSSHARARLPADLSAHLSAQLPLLVRGAYYDQYEPSKQPAQARGLDDFLGQVKTELASTPVKT